MCKVIIMGHGGYAEGMKQNIDMLVGTPDGYYYIDFLKTDDLNILKEKMNSVISKIEKEEDILFVCDLAGGSPFREAATLAAEDSRFSVVAGINTAALTEMTFHLEDKAKDLAKFAEEIAKEAIMTFTKE